MPNPLPVDNFATTTTGAAALTTPTPAPTAVVNASCNAADFMTPCGSQCCNTGFACYIWNDCEEASVEESTSSLSRMVMRRQQLRLGELLLRHRLALRLQVQVRRRAQALDCTPYYSLASPCCFQRLCHGFSLYDGSPVLHLKTRQG